jgi:hypothetical protein
MGSSGHHDDCCPVPEGLAVELLVAGPDDGLGKDPDCGQQSGEGDQGMVT